MTNDAMSRPEALLSWLQRPETTRGIHFATPADGWDFWSYERLAELTRRVAGGLLAEDLPRGSVVGVVQRSRPDFVATLFGVMAAGCAPAPIAPPLAFHDAAGYATHLAGLLRTARPAAVVVEPRLRDVVGTVARAAGVTRLLTVAELADGEAAPVAPAGTALVQFTSGSGGTAKGVRVPFAAIEANVHAIRRWLAMTPGDVTASWLPVHHDMGLVGCLLAPIVNRSDIRLMHPEAFIHDPLRYLRCFGESGAALTAMPAFGLDHIVRRVTPERLAGLDLTAWRAIIVGAERVDPRVLERFCALLAPCGFAPAAVLPAYGLAESTLAVTGLAIRPRWSEVEIDPAGLRFGSPVRRLASPGAGQRLVGCGTPLTGVSVRIEDDDGRALPPGTLGTITVGGTSVSTGYVADPPGGLTSFAADGTVRTGDAGFFGEDGQLYVLGRVGDSIKVRGRVVFAEDLEVALHAAGVPPQRSTILLGAYGATRTVVALFERARPEWLAAAHRILPRRTGDARLVVLDAPRGAILRTSSGKPKRRAMWLRWAAQETPIPPVSDGAGDGPVPIAAGGQP